MNTKIVYSLISDSNDYYLEQLILSIISLKKYNPTAYVEVVTDNKTEQSLIGWRSVLHNIVDRITIADIPKDLDNIRKSRYLKTTLRSIINGDYLFLDTDTIICSSLASIDDFSENIMMVADCNDPIGLQDVKVLKLCKTIGFESMQGKAYYNSGVILVKDSAISHSFYELWHSNWQKSTSKGINLDQPSLNYTNHKLGDEIQELPGIWNCQIYFKGFNSLYNAKVMHYAGGGSNNQIKEIYRIIRTEGVASKKIKKYINHTRTSLYMYLTSNDRSFNNRVMLLLNVKYHKLYQLLTKLFFHN